MLRQIVKDFTVEIISKAVFILQLSESTYFFNKTIFVRVFKQMCITKHTRIDQKLSAYKNK